MKVVIVISIFILSGCTLIKPVDTSLVKYYTLDSVMIEKSRFKSHHGIIVSMPTSDQSLQSNKMMYTRSEFQMEAYNFSRWVGTPPSMLHKLLLENFNKLQCYKAVSTNAISSSTKWKIETRILNWYQSYLRKPSAIHVSFMVTIYNIKSNSIVGTKLFEIMLPSPYENAYGGVIAMNEAMDILIPNVIRYVRRVTH